MTTKIKVPSLGAATIDGTIVAWFVQEGEEISRDQVVAEVETDKINVEIPSPYDGTVKKLLVAAGDFVTKFQPILDLERTDQVEKRDDELIVHKEEQQHLEAQKQRDHEATEAQRQRDHEAKMAMIELEKIREQRRAAEAARDAAALAKAQESEQFAAILKSLKDDES